MRGHFLNAIKYYKASLWIPSTPEKKKGGDVKKTEHLSKGLIIYPRVWVNLELTNKLDQKVLTLS